MVEIPKSNEYIRLYYSREKITDWHLANRIKNKLLGLTIDGQLISKPLSTRELADLLGIGQQPSDEEVLGFNYALAKLCYAGVIYQNRDKVGTPINASEAGQWLTGALHTRTYIEKDIVHNICTYSTQRSHFRRDLAKVEKDLQRLEQKPLLPVTDFLIFEGEYHDYLIGSFGFLISVDDFTYQILVSAGYFHPTEDDCQKLVSSHRAIFEALKGRQAEEAKSLVDAQAQKWLEIIQR